MRGPRFLPPQWTVEVVSRTIGGFFLLPTTKKFARTFVGVLAHAQTKYPVRVHCAVAVSTHYHMILSHDDPKQLADFMEFVNGNLAREANRLTDWKGPVFEGRYHGTPISPEPNAFEERLFYCLSHSVKENLVARISDWEGLHCADALIDGRPLTGVWHDRTGEYEAERQAQRRAKRRDASVEPIDRKAFKIPYQLKLAPLPCWAELPRAAIGKRVKGMVAKIEAKAAERREVKGKEPQGMDKIRDQDPLSRVVRGKTEPKPLCHAASDEMRDRMRQAYRGFRAMFREGSFKVKLGNVTEAVFPKWSFPPSLPFVRSGEEFDPLGDIEGWPGLEIWAAAPS